MTFRLRRFERAAVAAVLREGPTGAELLLIRRQRVPGRRWSGHVALPGGLREADDRSIAHTAQRECHEEVGLRLSAPLHRLRRVWSVRPRGARPMAIVPFAFAAPAGQRPTPETAEVAALDWVPLHVLRHAHRRWTWRRAGPLTVPAPHIELPVGPLWGLTLRIVDHLLRHPGPLLG